MWKTPAESPDLNPIENLWHELKKYIRHEIKPKTKKELIDGIQQVWGTVDQAKCNKYIGLPVLNTLPTEAIKMLQSVLSEMCMRTCKCQD